MMQASSRQSTVPATPTPAKYRPVKVGRKRTHKSLSLISPPCTQPTSEWKIFIITSKDDEGTLLPQAPEACVALIDNVLKKMGHYRLNAALILEKLFKVIRVTPHDRKMMKKVFAGPMKGWTIARAGKKRRLLLDINEEKGQIRMLFYPRQNEYHDILRTD